MIEYYSTNIFIHTHICQILMPQIPSDIHLSEKKYIGYTLTLQRHNLKSCTDSCISCLGLHTTYEKSEVMLLGPIFQAYDIPYPTTAHPTQNV